MTEQHLDASGHDAAATLAWRADRLGRVRAPLGPLALTGTHWLAEGEPVVVDGVPGAWTATGRVAVWQSPAGPVEVRPDSDDSPTELTQDGLELRLIEREGDLAVRVYDAGSPALAAFPGIDAWPHDPRWVLAGRWEPFGEGRREVRVPHVDGAERGIDVDGVLHVDLPEHVGGGTVPMLAEDTGEGLKTILRDATSGVSSYDFRFVTSDVPAPDGSVVLDLNRLYLPPCALSPHFLCPMPPPGNVLAVPVEAGEARVRR